MKRKDWNKKKCLNCGLCPIKKPKFCSKTCYGKYKTKNTCKIPKDKLIELYSNQKLEVSKIAEIFQLTVTTVFNYLKKYKIKLRGNYTDYTKTRVGNLFILEPIFPKIKKNQHLKWKCQCDCGNFCEIISSSLDGQHTTSCYECTKKRSRSKDELKNCVWTVIKNQKNRSPYRQLEFTISKQEAYDLFLKQGRKCALSGVDIKFAEVSGGPNKGETTASLDRIDSSKGYILGNVQWVHKILNTMKWTHSMVDFKNWINLTYNHLNKC